MDSLPAEPPGKSKNTGVGSLSFLQWILSLLLCRGILYQLSYQGSPSIIKPFLIRRSQKQWRGDYIINKLKKKNPPLVFLKASFIFIDCKTGTLLPPTQRRSIWRGGRVWAHTAVHVQTGPHVAVQHLWLSQGLPHRLRGREAPRQEHGPRKSCWAQRTSATRATQGSWASRGHFRKAVTGTYGPGTVPGTHSLLHSFIHPQ